jgi:hypothetical protein
MTPVTWALVVTAVSAVKFIARLQPPMATGGSMRAPSGFLRYQFVNVEVAIFSQTAADHHRHQRRHVSITAHTGDLGQLTQQHSPIIEGNDLEKLKAERAVVVRRGDGAG